MVAPVDEVWDSTTARNRQHRPALHGANLEWNVERQCSVDGQLNVVQVRVANPACEIDIE
jgi:hypothetical protein